MTSSRARAAKASSLANRRQISADRQVTDALNSIRADVSTVTSNLATVDTNVDQLITEHASMDAKLDTIITNTTP